MLEKARSWTRGRLKRGSHKLSVVDKPFGESLVMDKRDSTKLNVLDEPFDPLEENSVMDKRDSTNSSALDEPYGGSSVMAERGSTESSVPFEENSVGDEPYSYQQLPSDQHIRLLELYPVNETKHGLEGNLSIYELQNAPPYECLSYTWGRKDADRSLKLNSSAFPIRPNLEAALLRLRGSDEIRILWIDAVCIDQLNIPERNSQVSIMRDIYATADHVVVWLAKEHKDGSTARAFRTISKVANLSVDEIQQHAVNNIVSEKFRKDVLSLTDLIRRSWWTRVWVIQEFVVAKKSILLCGPHELLGREFGTYEKCHKIYCAQTIR
jgi:hypothetical protein